MALIETEYRLHFECCDCPTALLVEAGVPDDPRNLLSYGKTFRSASEAESHVHETGHHVHVHGILRASHDRQAFLYERQQQKRTEERLARAKARRIKK